MTDEVPGSLLRFDLTFTISLILLSLTFKESNIVVPYHFYTAFFSLASFRLIYLLTIFVQERLNSVSGNVSDVAAQINSYVLSVTASSFVFLVSEAVLSFSKFDLKERLYISIPVSVIVFIPLVIMTVKESRLKKISLEIPKRIIAYSKPEEGEESPFDIVIKNRTSHEINDVKIRIESSASLHLSIHHSQQERMEEDKTITEMHIRLEAKGRKFYVPEVKIQGESLESEVLKVQLTWNKTSIERFVQVEVR